MSSARVTALGGLESLGLRAQPGVLQRKSGSRTPCAPSHSQVLGLHLKSREADGAVALPDSPNGIVAWSRRGSLT